MNAEPYAWAMAAALAASLLLVVVAALSRKPAVKDRAINLLPLTGGAALAFLAITVVALLIGEAR